MSYNLRITISPYRLAVTLLRFGAGYDTRLGTQELFCVSSHSLQNSRLIGYPIRGIWAAGIVDMGGFSEDVLDKTRDNYSQRVRRDVCCSR